MISSKLRNNMHIFFVLIIISLNNSEAMANTQIITSCTEPSGYAYYFDKKSGNHGNMGWTKDKTPEGIILLILEDGKIKIQYKDTIGWRDVASDFGKIQLIPSTVPGFTHIIVIYPSGLLEDYLFKLDGDGTGNLLMGTFRPSDKIAKGSLMHASCHR